MVPLARCAILLSLLSLQFGVSAAADACAASVASQCETFEGDDDALLTQVELLQTHLDLQKKPDANSSKETSAKQLEDVVAQKLQANRNHSSLHPSIVSLVSDNLVSFLDELSAATAQTSWPAWMEKTANREQGRLIGISASVFLFLFCFWITTLKEVPPMMRESNKDGPTDLKTISVDELKKHNHQGDLWISVDGLVANLTDFATSHPGGVDLLLQHAGSEAAEPFHDVGHSEFALEQIQKRAVGFLENAKTQGAIAVEKDTVLSRIFTKEDPYNVHKVLGFTVLSMYLYRIFVWICQIEPEGTDYAGFRPDLWALASIFIVEGLQVSSFIFTVPQNRPLSGPMIWQEWRAHNLIFVSRLTICFLGAWMVNRYAAMAGWPSWAQMTVNQLSVFAQMRLADLATAWLRDDTHETLVSTMPYWEHCPKWVESMFRTWYSMSQIYTTVVIIIAGPGMDLYFVMILPYQLYSVLMTFVRKGVISSRTCHVTYFWSLWQSWICGFMMRSFRVFVQIQAISIFCYCTRVYGLNKYVLWIGACLSFQLVMLKNWPHHSEQDILDFPWFTITILTWAILGAGLKFFSSVPLFDSRHARYVEARPKRVILRSKTKVSSNLYHLKFDFPWFFRWQGYSSGLQPGQHVKILCGNASQGQSSWNGHINLEESRDYLSRSYTPINSSKDSTVDFIIKLYPQDPQAGFPDGGRGSTKLCLEVKEGEEVWLSGPHGSKVYRGNGNFVVDGKLVKASTCCALAGGSGITPVLSLLRQCREECRSSFSKPNAKSDVLREFSIIHAMRNMDERLETTWYSPQSEMGLAPHCTVTHLATGQKDGELVRQISHREGMAYNYGKLTKEIIGDIFPPPAEDLVVILCGPKGFVDGVCQPLLRELKYTNVLTMW
ncbi:unnamed protein product [Durusdinium trenchii]|uniref:Cytochrome b5 heme-binding domain-containing protein n=2 Tax=Durusdinium trenchii TaxID=1381693 RepID=A0ABP0HBZ5_9DINO